MGEHNPLGHTGCARGVEDSCQILGLRGHGKFLELGGIPAVKCFSLLLHFPYIQDAFDNSVSYVYEIFYVGQLCPDGIYLFPKIWTGTDKNSGLGVLDDIFDLFRGEDGVNRDSDPSYTNIGEIGDKPVRSVLRQYGQFVSRPVTQVL